MVNAGRFMLHRPEQIGSPVRGDEKLSELMKGSGQSVPAGRALVHADSEHDYVYRLRSGWACRDRAIADGRDQFILIFLPGDLFAVKSRFVTCHPDRIQTLSTVVIERMHYSKLQEAYARDFDIANRLRCIATAS
jgi:CRP/FNR family transcriptional regulator, anaerobic regulatory protein